MSNVSHPTIKKESKEVSAANWEMFDDLPVELKRVLASSPFNWSVRAFHVLYFINKMHVNRIVDLIIHLDDIASNDWICKDDSPCLLTSVPVLRSRYRTA